MRKIFNLQSSIFNSRKGFSLIELLIVICIIGILSTIILNNVSTSRAKAYDSRVKQQLTSFRTSAEAYFQNHSDSYGSYANCNAGGPTSLFQSLQVADGQPGIYIDQANLPNGATPICQALPSAYAVKIPLHTGVDYWCVDSTGASMQTSNGVQSTVCN